MRKVLIAVVGALLLTGVAFAQDEDTVDVAPNGDTWLGASTGYPFGLTAHYGLGDALGDGVDLRFNGRFAFSGDLVSSTIGFNLGADALFAIPVDSDEVHVYAGAGPSLGFAATTYNAGVTGGNLGGFVVGAQGLAGAEYLLTDQIGLFGELRVGFTYVTGINFAFAPTLALGANYHF